jgi:hypothetical protein
MISTFGSLPAAIWSLAVFGVIFKLFYTGRFKRLSTLIYIAMGWLVLVAIKPMWHSLDGWTLGWLFAGGLSYTLGADCGGVWGEQALLCGPGALGQQVAFSCPSATAVPACLWYDAAAGAWSGAGCSVLAAGAGAVTCACSRLAPFALRFAALQVNDNDLFAADGGGGAAGGGGAVPTLLLGVCAALVAAGAAGACLGAAKEAAFRGRYAAALSRDREVQWLGEALAESGAELALGGGEEQQRGGVPSSGATWLRLLYHRSVCCTSMLPTNPLCC